MTTGLPTLVLRGSGDVVLRCQDDAVTLRRAREELHIPFAAIARVHAAQRTVTVELTAPEGAEAASYRVTDVSEAAATAFAAAVSAALPDERALDGGTLVVRSVFGAPARRRDGRLLAAVAAVPVVGLDVFLGVAGHWGYAGLFWPAFLFAALGVFLVWFMGQGLYRMWYLPKHGITTVAEFSHFTNNTRVYRYTDTTGASHTHNNNVGGDRFELSYDPRDPKVAVQREGLYVRCMMALMAVIGCGLAGGGLYAIGWLAVTSLTD
ncbi:hypothetical protein [Streptomyces sp. NPDC056144]|uniref:hypothetical protein n=1 Tax=unclassified Streptomyces TaxID=2593676 RepID=UPI0035DA458B